MRTLLRKAQIEERERERQRPVAPPFSSHRRRSSAQISHHRPFGPRCLLRRCQRNPLLQPSNIVGLKFGWTGQRLGWTGKRSGWTSATPDDVVFLGGRGGVARSWEREHDLEQYGNVVECYRAGEPNKLAGKARNIDRIVCRWQNVRERGQPARYMCRQGTSSVATQDVAPTCTHLTSLARTSSSRQLAMGGTLRRWSE